MGLIDSIVEASKQDSLLDRLAAARGWDVKKMIADHNAEIHALRNRELCCECGGGKRLPEMSYCKACRNRRGRDYYQRKVKGK